MSLQDTVEKLRKLEAEATPSPWRQGYVFFSCKMDHGVTPDGKKVLHGQGECRYTLDGWSDDAYHIINQDPGYGQNDEPLPDTQVAGNCDYEEGGIVKKEDTAVICALRNAAPALLQVLSQFRPGDAAQLHVAMHALEVADIHLDIPSWKACMDCLTRLQDACRLMEG